MTIFYEMRYLTITLLILSISSPLAASSQTSPFINTSSLGIGGAGRTYPLDNSAIELNPATISLLPFYTIEFNYQSLPLLSSRLYNLSIRDSRTSPLALAISYTYHSYSKELSEEERPPWREADEENDQDYHRHQVFSTAISYPFLKRTLNFGINLKGLWYNHEIGERISTFNMDAGMVYKPHRVITLAFGANNMILDEFEEVSTDLFLGFGITPFDILFIGFDPSLKFEKGKKGVFHFGLGAQIFIFDQLLLRTGLIRDIEEIDHITFGIGWNLQKWYLNYSVGYSLEQESDFVNRFLHSFAIGINM